MHHICCQLSRYAIHLYIIHKLNFILFNEFNILNLTVTSGGSWHSFLNFIHLRTQLIQFKLKNPAEKLKKITKYYVFQVSSSLNPEISIRFNCIFVFNDIQTNKRTIPAYYNPNLATKIDVFHSALLSIAICAWARLIIRFVIRSLTFVLASINLN